MKVTLLALVVGLLLVGCEESSTPSDPVDTPKAIDLDDKKTRDKIIAEAIDMDKLKQRPELGGVAQVGHSGRRADIFYAPNERTPYTGWVKQMYDNRQIMMLSQSKAGKPEGLETEWYENGQKEGETNYKDGKTISVVVWKPNGEKCPVTKIDKDGNGVRIFYNKDGTEADRGTYKRGRFYWGLTP